MLHDSERISQVLTNLIKNSLNAVKQESGAIEVLTEDTDNAIIISVKDNGIGIPEEKQKDLFKKFYQVDATLHEKEEVVDWAGNMQRHCRRTWRKNYRSKHIKHRHHIHANHSKEPLIS